MEGDTRDPSHSSTAATTTSWARVANSAKKRVTTSVSTVG